MDAANSRRHKQATAEHLLLVLTDDKEAKAVLEACGVDIALLKIRVAHYINVDLQHLARRSLADIASPTFFQKVWFGLQRLVGDPEAIMNAILGRVVLRTRIHHQASSSKKTMTGAHLLAQILSEEETPAASFLREQKMERVEALNYVSHGIPKGGLWRKEDLDTAAHNRAGLYGVYLLNDDYTPMDFVVFLLERIFEKSRQAATQLMLQIHRNGAALCGVYPFEAAEKKVDLVNSEARKNKHPLRCVMERELENAVEAT